MDATQNLGVVLGDTLDCRNDTQSAVGDEICVINVSNPAERREQYVTRTRAQMASVHGGAWQGTYQHPIGEGVVTEVNQRRCAVRIERFPSQM